MIGALLDRMAFWNLPGPFASYSLETPFESFRHHGLEVWKVAGSGEGPSVLFCHGNAGNLRFPKARGARLMAIHQTGADLWAFDYRGYGRSAGRPTEKGVYEDAARVYSLMLERLPSGRPVVLFGRSLGGAVATYLATELKQPDLLVLESTFTSAPDVCAAWTHPRVAALMSYQFNSRERISRITCPVRMIHGTQDRVVPFTLGRALYQSCLSDKEFVEVSGAGHNNLQQKAGGLYENTLSRWLNGIRPSRQGADRS